MKNIIQLQLASLQQLTQLLADPRLNKEVIGALIQGNTEILIALTAIEAQYQQEISQQILNQPQMPTPAQQMVAMLEQQRLIQAEINQAQAMQAEIQRQASSQNQPSANNGQNQPVPQGTPPVQVPLNIPPSKYEYADNRPPTTYLRGDEAIQQQDMWYQ